MNKQELRYYYNISYPTLYKWLRTVPNLILVKFQREFTPLQLELIHKHLG